MLRGNPFVSTTVSVLASVLAVSGIVYAATTIGTNVSIDGTLTQTGAAAFAAGVNASSTLLVTGAVTHYGNSTFGDAVTDVNLFTGTLQASTTALFTTGMLTYGNSTFGDAATDVNLFTGTLQASTTALFTTGLLTYGNSTFGDAATDVNLFTGTLQASTTALFTNGLTAYATSTLTGAKVGGSGTTFVQIIAGFCNIPTTTVTASSTDYADCAGATGVAANDRVFVMATSSLAEGLFITAASSTADNTINVRIMNTAPTGVAIATGNISFNFWAFK